MKDLKDVMNALSVDRRARIETRAEALIAGEIRLSGYGDRADRAVTRHAG